MVCLIRCIIFIVSRNQIWGRDMINESQCPSQQDVDFILQCDPGMR